MNEHIVFHNRPVAILIFGFFGVVTVYMALLGVRLLLGKTRRDRPARAGDGAGRVLGAVHLLLAMSFGYVVVDVARKEGVQAVEFGERSVTFHELWRTRVVPYTDVASVETKITRSRGTRRSGTRTRVRVYVRTRTRGFEIRVKYYDAEARAKAERVAEILRARTATP